MLTSRLWLGLSSSAVLCCAPLAMAQVDDSAAPAKGPAKGQGAEPATPESVHSPALLSIDRLRGVEVALGERSVDGSLGAPDAIVGRLKDLVLDRKSRRLTHAVVKTAEGLQVVPAARMGWHVESETWVLAMTAEQFAEAPAFDLAQLDPGGRPVEAGAGTGGEQEVDATAARHITLAELAKARVLVAEGALGQVESLVIHATEPTLAFLIVKPQRSQAVEGQPAPASVPVPWSLCELGRPEATEEGERIPVEEAPLALRVDASRAAVLGAPRPGQVEGRRLADSAFRRALYAHFGIRPQVFDALEAKNVKRSMLRG